MAALVLPTLHFLWCLAIHTRVIPPSEGSWTWFPVFVVDFPFSVLSLLAADALHDSLGVNVPALVVFGLTGTIWWYGLSMIVVGLVSRSLRRSQTKA